MVSGVRIAALLAASLMAAIVWFRHPIVERVFLRQLRATGVDEVALEIGRFDFETISLRDLRLGAGPELSAGRIEADYSLRGLLEGRLDALRISDVALYGSLDDSGLSFGSLDPLLAPSGDADASNSGVLPAASVDIDDVQLKLATPTGPLEASLSAHSHELEDGRLEAEAELRVTHPMATWVAQLNATGTLRSLAGNLKLEASAREGSIASVSASGVSMAAEAKFQLDAAGIVLRLKDCATLGVDRLSIEGLVALSEPLELCVRAGPEPSLGISSQGDVSAQIEIAEAHFAGDLYATGGALRVSGQLPAILLGVAPADGGLEITVATEGGHLELSDPAIRASGIFLDARLDPGADAPRGQLRIDALADAGYLGEAPELSLVASFGPETDRLHFEAELSDAARNLVLTADGAHDLSSGAGRADVALQRVRFCPGQLQPGDLFGLTRDWVTGVSGSVEATGAVQWDADGFAPELEVGILDVRATSELAVVEHLNAAIELDSSGSSPHQLLSIGRIDFGMELTDGLINYQVQPEGIISIESATWGFAGGVLATAGEIDPLATEQELSFQVRDVDLTQLFQLVNLEGLSGSGTLEGRLPIFRDADAIEIRGGKLRSGPEGGVVRYHPDAGTANLGVADPNVATTLSVLENFHFELLEIGLDGDPSGEVVVSVRLKGANPDYRDGYPVDFNLSLEARLPELLRMEGFVYQIPDAIEARLRKFSGSGPSPVNFSEVPCVHDG